MNLQQVLQNRGIKYRTSPKDPNRIYLCCPFCISRGETPDSRFRLGLHTTRGTSHCFNCRYSASHNAIQQLLRALRLTDTVEGGPVEQANIIQEQVTLPEGFHTLIQPHGGMDLKAYDYLRERGVTREQIARNQIGVTFLGDYAWRVVFPVYEGKQLHALVARALNSNMKPRYLNSHGEKHLYNFHPTSPTIVLLEGVFKCLRVEQVSNGTNACALLGHDITDLQLEQLTKAGVKNVVLWPDPDRAGRRGMLHVDEKLKESSITCQLVTSSEPADEAAMVDLQACWDTRKPMNWGARRLLANQT